MRAREDNVCHALFSERARGPGCEAMCASANEISKACRDVTVSRAKNVGKSRQAILQTTPTTNP